MRALIAAQLSVWHFRAANWHFQRGEAWIWRHYAYTDPKRSRWTQAKKMIAAGLLGLAISVIWLWIIGRAAR